MKLLTKKDFTFLLEFIEDEDSYIQKEKEKDKKQFFIFFSIILGIFFLPLIYHCLILGEGLLMGFLGAIGDTVSLVVCLLLAFLVIIIGFIVLDIKKDYHFSESAVRLQEFIKFYVDYKYSELSFDKKQWIINLLNDKFFEIDKGEELIKLKAKDVIVSAIDIVNFLRSVELSRSYK